jgi:DNA polymerase/3'-5' exonuclease PolX
MDTPEKVLAAMPGIGKTLAARIRNELGIETIEDLAAAARDGRLEHVTRFGARRTQRILAALQRLGLATDK